MTIETGATPLGYPGFSENKDKGYGEGHENSFEKIMGLILNGFSDEQKKILKELLDKKYDKHEKVGDGDIVTAVNAWNPKNGGSDAEKAKETFMEQVRSVFKMEEDDQNTLHSVVGMHG